ncbi:MAG TPA: rRNA maturation RNase YbeY [Acholeplasmataceae bacterium]|nr:rRNA maturation RNase YbeY [Acholeplasmataceae bacterium]
MKINFHNKTDLEIKNYIKIIKKAFKYEKKNNKQKTMEIVFVTPEEIKRLNKYYRNIDKSTDVLSFINDDSEESLGDIFINIEQALLQANEYGHSTNRELAFLAVHGYLHLKGYDHESKEDEKIMFEKQEMILNKAKIERKI